MTANPDPSKTNPAEVFAFFTEVGIINQLSVTMLASALPGGVHPSHFAIINHLHRVGDGTTPVRIAAAMQVTKTTMTHSLKVLKDHGFVRIAPNPEDGRAKKVFLTASGSVFRNEAIQRVSKRFGHALQPEHIEIMSRISGDLETLRKHLDKNR
ncbi:MarR family transcriptional regulator [Rhodobacteraceae bacterium]|nr:MarR family transcriptional regulator [Paracoccaceae bacterium]